MLPTLFSQLIDLIAAKSSQFKIFDHSIEISANTVTPIFVQGTPRIKKKGGFSWPFNLGKNILQAGYWT